MAKAKAETEALRALLEQRRRGGFIGLSEGRKRTRAMLERKKGRSITRRD